MEVRERIAREISETRGVSVTADNVVITPGAKPIMFFVILALVDEGGRGPVPQPGIPDLRVDDQLRRRSAGAHEALGGP